MAREQAEVKLKRHEKLTISCYLDPKKCPHLPTARRGDGTCGMCGKSWVKPPPTPSKLDEWIERARRSTEPSPIVTLERKQWPSGVPENTAEVRGYMSKWTASDVRGSIPGQDNGAQFPHQALYRIEYRLFGCSTWHASSVIQRTKAQPMDAKRVKRRKETMSHERAK